MEISVIIPAYNEDKIIGKNISKVINFLESSANYKKRPDTQYDETDPVFKLAKAEAITNDVIQGIRVSYSITIATVSDPYPERNYMLGSIDLVKSVSLPS